MKIRLMYTFHLLMKLLHQVPGPIQSPPYHHHKAKAKHYRHLLAVVLFFLLQPSTKADFQTEEQQTIQTAQKLLAATVKIQPESLSKGTGFYITRDMILTNEHVIHLASGEIPFTRYDGIRCTGRVGYREEGADLALIRTDCLSDHVLTIADGARIGQSIVVAGNPGSYDFTLSKGIVSALRADRIQFDARVDFGSSGGVMADLGGNVLGVVTEKSRADNYIAFAIPSNRIKQFLGRAGISHLKDDDDASS